MAETYLGKLGEAPVVILCGPIAHWWDDNWETPEHLHYNDWRDRVSARLVKEGYLVYHPHNAFKGAWNNRMQKINSQVIELSDVVINLNPGVPSDGTDEEMVQCSTINKPVIYAPPPSIEHWSPVTKIYADLSREKQPLDKLVAELSDILRS